MLTGAAHEAKRGPSDDEPAGPGLPHIDVDESEDEDTSSGGRIRCPECGWQPRKHDRWLCTCLHAWNTFETAGLCPSCGKQWSETQCLRCGLWSKHERWYGPEGEGRPE